jgi:hypothetical protein
MSNVAAGASGVPAGVCFYSNMFSDVLVHISVLCIHVDKLLLYRLLLIVPKQVRDCHFLFILLVLFYLF